MYIRRINQHRCVETGEYPIAISMNSEWGFIRTPQDQYQLVRFLEQGVVQRYHTYYEESELHGRAYGHVLMLG